MKKILSTIISIILLSVFTINTANAQYSVMCIDCSKETTSLLEYAKQGLQLAKESVTAQATTITAVQQTLSTVKQTITDPLKRAMAYAAILSSSNLIQNLISGSNNGKILLISDPQKYVKNAGLASINLNLGTIGTQNGPYTGSLFSAIISNYKNNDATSKLAALNQSVIPSNTQKERCTDSALTSQAKSDVIRSDNTYDQTELQTRKQELYNTLCKCDPRTDTSCAQILTAVNNQRPTLDSFYAITQGENEYAKSVATLNVIEEEKRNAEQAKIDDLNRGGGIASQTTCVSYGVDGSGNKVCAKEAIVGLSSQLNKLFGEAANPFPTLQSNLSGASFLGDLVDLVKTGVDITRTGLGIVSGVNNVMNTTQDLANTVTGIVDSSPTSGGLTIPKVNSPTDVSSSNTTQKAELIAPIQQQLDTQLRDLDNLSGVDNIYLSSVTAHGARLDSLKGCYDTLVKDYPLLSGDGQISSAMSYYTTKKTTLGTISSSLQNELSSIPIPKNSINTIVTNIKNANSTQSILDQFTSYQNDVDTINVETATQREQEMADFQDKVTTDTSSSGDITFFTTQCATIRTQQQQQQQYNVPF